MEDASWLTFFKAWRVEIVAWLALLLPGLRALWRRFVKPGVVEIYKTGTLEVGYSVFGATIGLFGTLRARDRDLFVRSANLQLVIERDQARRRLEWGVFRSSRLVLGRPEQMTVELPAGFMLLTSQPFRYNIQFHDIDLQGEVRPILERVQTAWWQAVALAGGAATLGQQGGPAWNTLYQTFSQSPAHVAAFVAIDRLCYWVAGRYRVTLTVETARPDRHFEESWTFALSDDEVERLRLNALLIVQATCGQTVQNNFAYVPYQ